jgi:hypothetical protein
MNALTMNPKEGERRKLDALATLAAWRERLVLAGRRALLRRLIDAGTATADDVREAVEIPIGVDPVCLGAVPCELARAGIIERAGFTESRRPDAHARPVSVWRLVDRNAALMWLAAHPPIVEDTQHADGMLFDTSPPGRRRGCPRRPPTPPCVRFRTRRFR